MISPQEFQAMLQKFTQLDYSDQHSKVIKSLQGFAELDPKYAELLEMIQTDTQHKIPTEILVEIYEAVMTLGYEAQQLDHQQAMNKLDSASTRLKDLQQQEQLEQQKEHPDALLDQIA